MKTRTILLPIETALKAAKEIATGLTSAWEYELTGMMVDAAESARTSGSNMTTLTLDMNQFNRVMDAMDDETIEVDKEIERLTK